MQGLSEGHGLRAGRGPRSVGSYGRRPCRRLNVSQGSHCVYSFPGYNQASDALQSAQQRFRLSIFRRGPSSPQASRETKTWSAFQDVVTVKTGGGDGGGNGGPPSSKSVGEDGDAPGPSSETANIDAILAKAGQSVQNLPKDIQEALARGAVTPADITQWLKIASTPILGAICQALPAFRDRVMGNPRFLLVLAIEEAYGLQRKADGRGPRPGKGVLAGDKHGVLGHGAGGGARAVMQVGSYTVGQRAATVAYRGIQFFFVGFLSSVIGHSLTTYLVDQQKKKKKQLAAEAAAKAVPPKRSLAWGSFMALSSNTRYQIVNGIEERVVDATVQSGLAKSAITFILRFGNTWLGGLQWMAYAKYLGVQ
eukprot:jgi/Botrbrau1/3050/Bobra.0070s0045.1